MKKLIDFEINDVKIEKLLDDSTALVRLRIITEGMNKHNLPMSIEVIKEAAERSLRGKPILATYSNWQRDLEGHKRPEDSEPIGYILENQVFEYLDTPTGKALFALGLLWKRYAPSQVGAIYNGENHSKDVSMEISVDSLIDENDPSKGIAAFSYLGICILGEKYPPASDGAEATLLTFSEMKEKYEMMFAAQSMRINNSKDATVMSETYVNPGRRLYSAISKKSNAMNLYKEAYLIIDESKINSTPSEAFSYPHHSIKDGELVLNVAGCQVAMQRAKQVNLSGEALEHLKRHYTELNLDVSNFSTNFEEKEESKLEEKVMMTDPKEEEKFEEEKPEPEAKPEGDVEEKEEDEKEEEDFALKYSETEKKLEEYTAKFAAQEEELNTLRKYKADKEESEKNYAIEQTMAEVNEYLPKDEAEKFRAEAAEVKFSEVEAFKNKIKARSLDFAKTSQIATNRMAIVRDTEEKKDKWGW